MNLLERLKKMQEQLGKRIEDCFAKFVESAKVEDLEAYNALNEQLRKIEDQIAAEEAKAARENDKPEPAAETVRKHNDRYSQESRDWAKKVMEAIAVGNTYTSLVPTEVSSVIEKKIESYSLYRRFCTVHKASGNYTFAVEGDGVTVNYVAEAASVAESTPSVNMVQLKAYNLAALVKLSKESVDDPAIDFIEYVTEQMGKGFAKKEDAEFISGTGSANSHITGILTTLKAESGTPQIVTGTGSSASAPTFTWAELKSMFGKLGEYRKGAKIICNQTTLDYIHEFKDDGKYIFDQNKPLENIWGMDVIVDSNIDDAKRQAASGADAYPLIVANLAFYHICDRQDLEMQTLNELYAQTRQVGVIADKRIDAMLSQTAAFCAMKIAKAS